MTPGIPSALLLGVVALPPGAVGLFLNRIVSGRSWRRPGSAGPASAELRRLRRDVARVVSVRRTQAPLQPTPEVSAIVSRLAEVEMLAYHGQVAAAAESAQWLQWETLQAQLRGAISREVATRLIDDTQALCEDLWMRERVAAPTRH